MVAINGTVPIRTLKSLLKFLTLSLLVMTSMLLLVDLYQKHDAIRPSQPQRLISKFLAFTLGGSKSITTCSSPALDPFDESVMKHYTRYPPLDCSEGIPSVVDFVGGELKINPHKVKMKLGLASVQGCAYRSISRAPGSDLHVTYGPWSENFTSSISLSNEKEEDNVQVDCHHQGRLVARSYLALIRKRGEVEEKRLEDYQKHVKEYSPRETLSVLMVGLEATSKYNFIRSMPKTREFIVDKMKAVEYHRCNKLGYNTFPNVVSLFTGLSENELKSSNNWTNGEKFDRISHLFVWSLFQKAGYRTSLVVDMTNISEFHYLRKGWTNPPFDFYYRPVILASETDDVYTWKKQKLCSGDTPAMTSIYDYWLQLTAAFNNTPSSPYFGYSLLTRLSHNYPTWTSAGDEMYLSFFKELVERGVLNNTVIVFFGDHGERFGDLRNTYNGMLETKISMLYFMFPPWFKQKYPEIMNNLRINANRLTTFFDLHATLKDVLYFTGNPRKASPLDRSISLFTEIPANRTCGVAGIQLPYCSCIGISREDVSSSKVKDMLVRGLLDDIISRTKNHRHLCVTLKVGKVLAVSRATPEIGHSDPNMASIYHLIIQTTPGDGVYEAMLSMGPDGDVTVTGDITRNDLRGEQAWCVPIIEIEDFCYCSVQ